MELEQLVMTTCIFVGFLTTTPWLRESMRGGIIHVSVDNTS